MKGNEHYKELMYLEPFMPASWNNFRGKLVPFHWNATNSWTNFF